MNYFTFDNQKSSDFGLTISQKDIYSAPVSDVSLVPVPGRNGDVLLDNNRFNNITVSYDVAFRNVKSRASAIKLWLCRAGYFVLTDTYQPTYFRMAAFSSNLKIDELIENVGQAQISFNCKPFMYSLAGQETITQAEPGTVTNPETFAALPYIKITGSGDITRPIGSNSYSITGVSSYIELDSELMAAYKGSVLCNDKINFTEFPVLTTGANSISWTGTVSKVEIVPRWRTL
jgi:predicted phage tail component-like protein